MGGGSSTVLVVEASDRERAEFGVWLEEAGYEVIPCPGPTAPDYTCIGGRAGDCPLVREADVVVLDLALLGEEIMEGIPAEELLNIYVTGDTPVVALGSWRRSPDPVEEERVVRISRHPGRDALVDAVHRLTGRAPVGAGP